MKQDLTRQWLRRAMVRHPALLVSITLPASRGNSLLLVSCTRLMSPLKHTRSHWLALLRAAGARLSTPGTPAYGKGEA